MTDVRRVMWLQKTRDYGPMGSETFEVTWDDPNGTHALIPWEEYECWESDRAALKICYEERKVMGEQIERLRKRVRDLSPHPENEDVLRELEESDE